MPCDTGRGLIRAGLSEKRHNSDLDRVKPPYVPCDMTEVKFRHYLVLRRDAQP